MGTDRPDLANMTQMPEGAVPVEISDNIEMNQFRVVEKRTLKTLNERRGAGEKEYLIQIIPQSKPILILK